jgi:hypothetical protein
MSDQLDPIFEPPPDGPALPVTYRQGTVVAWDPLTAENTIRVGGTELQNLPVLNTSEVVLLLPGDTVGLIGAGSSMAILGRLTIPGTDAAATALNALAARMAADAVAAGDSTTSTTYTDLAHVGPTCTDVLITKAGKALVIVGFTVSVVNQYASMSFEVSGATAVPPDDLRAFSLSTNTIDADIISLQSNAVVLLTDLNPGYHTFRAKYRTTSVAPFLFFDRNLVVIPL